MTEIADPKRRMLVSNDTTFFALAARGAPSLVVILGALAANLRRSNEEPRCMGTMTKALIIALAALSVTGPARGDDLSPRICHAIKAAVPNWHRSQEQCSQQFDTNFFRAKTDGFDPPAGAACWYLLYRNLSRKDRPIDRNLTKKERERAIIACYKAAGITCSRGARPDHCA